MKRLLLAGLLACAPVRAESQLADAVQKADHVRVKSLLAKQIDVNSAQTDGMTALHWASQKNDSETAKLLLQAGANVKATNRYGVTALWLACQNGNGAMVEILLAAGA